MPLPGCGCVSGSVSRMTVRFPCAGCRNPNNDGPTIGSNVSHNGVFAGAGGGALGASRIVSSSPIVRPGNRSTIRPCRTMIVSRRAGCSRGGARLAAGAWPLGGNGSPRPAGCAGALALDRRRPRCHGPPRVVTSRWPAAHQSTAISPPRIRYGIALMSTNCRQSIVTVVLGGALGGAFGSIPAFPPPGELGGMPLDPLPPDPGGGG